MQASSSGSAEVTHTAEPQPTSSDVSTSPTVVPSPTVIPIPTRKILSGGQHVFQSFNNCGPASLSMALSYLGENRTQAALGQALRPYQNSQGNNDDKSVTLPELAAWAEDAGFLAYHRPAGSVAVLEQLVALDIPVITRTWLNPGEDIGHYRVVVGYDQQTGQLLQDDSLQGNDIWYSHAEYNQIWQAFNYEFLVLVPAAKQLQVAAILAAAGLLEEQQAWEQALSLARQQLVAQPNDTYAQFNAAVALYELGEYQEAITAYEQVADRLPKRMLWYQIEPIKAYFQVADYSTVMTMTEAIFESQNRGFSELQYLRGLIFETRDQPVQAQQAFELAQQYNRADYWQVNIEELRDAN